MSAISNRHHLMSREFLFSRWGVLITMGIIVSIIAITTALLIASPSDTSVDNPSSPAISAPVTGGEPVSVAPAASCGVMPSELAGVDESTMAVVMQSSGVVNGEITSVPLILSQAPGGLAGYFLEVSLDNSSAVIRGVEYPNFGMTRELFNTGSEIKFAVADIYKIVESGATDSTIATLNIEGLGEGNSGFSINVIQMDDDSGGVMLPQTIAGALTIC